MVTGVQLATLGLNPDEFNDLSPEELSAVESILGEISKGNTDQYDELYYTDYEEIPVDFITFINDPRYLGNSTKGGQLVYDFWKKEGTRIVNGDEVEVALSGAIGTGKSTAACLMLAYILYKNMCLRNPQEFFNLRPGSKITLALLNNTLASSYGVGFDTLQSFLCDSPWFLEHGTVSGRTDETKHYIPDKGFQIIVGSRIQHTLGLNVIAALIDELNFAPGQDAAYTKCLVGSTVIRTSEGDRSLKELAGQTLKVWSYSRDKGIILSDECTVVKTMDTTELVKISLEDGSTIECTPFHRLMLKDGTYKMAKDLTEDDELEDINLGSID